jgi:hypothetical protein
MQKSEFIKKWLIGYEDKEQELEFTLEMEMDLDAVINDSSPHLKCTKYDNQSGCKFRYAMIEGCNDCEHFK